MWSLCCLPGFSNLAGPAPQIMASMPCGMHDETRVLAQLSPDYSPDPVSGLPAGVVAVYVAAPGQREGTPQVRWPARIVHPPPKSRAYITQHIPGLLVGCKLGLTAFVLFCTIVTGFVFLVHIQYDWSLVQQPLQGQTLASILDQME